MGSDRQRHREHVGIGRIVGDRLVVIGQSDERGAVGVARGPEVDQAAEWISYSRYAPLLGCREELAVLLAGLRLLARREGLAGLGWSVAALQELRMVGLRGQARIPVVVAVGVPGAVHSGRRCGGGPRGRAGGGEGRRAED